MYASILLTASVFLPTQQAGAIDLELAERAFAQAEALSAADGGALWGVPLYGPMLLVDPATRQVVANQQDGAGTLTTCKDRTDLWAGVLPEAFQVANTAFQWDQMQWTMVLWPLPEDRYTRGRLLMHECFHRIQDELNLPAVDADNGHLDRLNGRIWMRMEWRALREALLHEGHIRLEAIEDALIFRAHRRSLFPSAADAERLLELNEGLAEYTGLRLSGLPLSVLADRAAVQLAQYDTEPTFVRNFAYASGPAYGLLLDASWSQWRRAVTSASDLGDMLANAAGVTRPPAHGLEAEAQRRAHAYDDGRVIDPETRRDERRQRRQAQFKARFIQGPILELPASEQVSYSFDPNMVEALHDVGTVYLVTTVKDAWGTLTVTANGALMIREHGRVKSFRVPAPPDPAADPIAGDGWMLELAERWTLQPAVRDGDWVVRQASAEPP